MLRDGHQEMHPAIQRVGSFCGQAYFSFYDTGSAQRDRIGERYYRNISEETGLLHRAAPLWSVGENGSAGRRVESVSMHGLRASAP